MYSAASRCKPGGESLSSDGRGDPAAENVGRPAARCSGYQLCGHSVRTLLRLNTIMHMWILW